MEENGEDTHAMQTEENLEERGSHDPEEVDGSHKNDKESKGNSERRGKRKAPAAGGQATPKKPESKEALTPLIDRPARERKSIERFADSVEKEKEKPKEFKIDQGSGMHLRDIPNVVFKLSKRKTSDEPVQLLHKLLYNKKVKPHQVKANILQFSGFLWGPNEEKEKLKMKEKLEKVVKENLIQVGDLLDLSITKTTKKEDVISRVFEFLECPHKTTEKLVQEQEQRLKEKKRKKTPAKGKRTKKSSSHTPRKLQKQEDNEEEQDEEMEEDGQEEEAQEEQLETEEEEEEEKEEDEEEPEEEPELPTKKRSIKNKEPSRDAKPKPTSAKKPSKRSAGKSSAPEDVEDDDEEPIEEPEEEAEAEPEEDVEEPKRKRLKNKKYDDDEPPKSPKKGARKSVKKKSVYEPGEEDLDDVKEVKSKSLSKVSKNEAPKEAKTPVGGSSKEKKKSATSTPKASSRKREHNDDAPEATTKKVSGAGRRSASKEESVPLDEDLRAAICELLRNADFSTVTFTDVVKQLGAKFNVDLSQNKAHVRNLIQEEISKIVDEDGGDEDNEDEEAGVNTPERGEKEPIEGVAAEE